MVILKTPSPAGTTFTLAVKCQLNPGVLDKKGCQKPTPSYIYVNDCLWSWIQAYTSQLLTSCIEAIFVVLSELNTSLRQCPLTLDKWSGLKVGHQAIQMGLVFDSQKLTIGITRDYLDKVLNILQSEWPELHRLLTKNRCNSCRKIGLPQQSGTMGIPSHDPHLRLDCTLSSYQLCIPPQGR